MVFEDVDLVQISDAFEERHQRLATSTAAGPDFSLGSSNQFHNAFVELMKLLSHAQDVLHPPVSDAIVQTKNEAARSSSWLLALFQHFETMNQDWKTKHMSVFDGKHVSLRTPKNFEQARSDTYQSLLWACPISRE
jgi:hypothetical protein